MAGPEGIKLFVRICEGVSGVIRYPIPTSYNCSRPYQQHNETSEILQEMQKELSELTDQELLQEAKKNKPNSLYDAVIFGILIGIAIYSTVNNGFGLLTFLPLVYIPIAAKNKTKNIALEKLLKERNLK
jgi:hypothetical protein